MKRMSIAVTLLLTAGSCMRGLAGTIDSPGPPSQGSGMYSLEQIYGYLLYGAPLAMQNSFEQPVAGPAATMRTLRGIGDDIKTRFDQCDTFPSNVIFGKKFFCTQGAVWGVQTGTATQGPQGLLRTGQTVEIRPGDDGTYQKGIDFSYTDNGDGTVTDNVTGLVWAGDGNGEGCAYGTKLSWNQAIDWAENLVFAGYSDWRLPNIRELASTIDYSVYWPAINATFFPNTRDDDYWSSTTYSLENYRTFVVQYIDGNVNLTLNVTWYLEYVRAVRGGR